jgi:phosphatidate phosphatase PAH1
MHLRLTTLYALSITALAAGCMDNTGLASETCSEHLVLTTTPQGWAERSTDLVVEFGRAAHRAQDQIVAQGAPQQVIAKFAYGRVDKDLKGEWVDIYARRTRCGPWERLGSERTSQDGEHGKVGGVQDDGGRIFFTIPSARALPLGRTPLRLVVRGDHSQAAMDLYVVEPSTQVVVFDIDGTLTTDDNQIVQEVAAEVLHRSYVPQARPGALALVRHYAEQGFPVLYLTGRPDLLQRITTRWLSQQGFPQGPLRLADHLHEVLPQITGVGTFKAKVLTAWQGPQHGLQIHAAYGNAPTDIYAYETAQIPKDHTFIIGPHGGEGDTVGLQSYPAHLSTLQANRQRPQSRD